MYREHSGRHGFVDGSHAYQMQTLLSAGLFERRGALAALRVHFPFSRGRFQLLRFAERCEFGLVG
jgi:hypothetical protein